MIIFGRRLHLPRILAANWPSGSGIQGAHLHKHKHARRSEAQLKQSHQHVRFLAVKVSEVYYGKINQIALLTPLKRNTMGGEEGHM